jgi:hypothetical protein
MTLGVITTSRFKLSRTTYAIITLGSIKLGFTTHSRMNAMTSRMTLCRMTLSTTTPRKMLLSQATLRKMTLRRMTLGFMAFIRITLNIALRSITLGRKTPGANVIKLFTSAIYECS